MNGHCYFPPLNGPVDCSQCEAENCRCRGMYQRDRRDFSYTSGRCPRLPDLRGFVEPEVRRAYAETFMLVHAEFSEGNLELTVTIPGSKRYRKVYQAKSGSWYFRAKSREGDPVRQALYINGFCTAEGITQYMEALHNDYCILRCDLAGFTV